MSLVGVSMLLRLLLAVSLLASVCLAFDKSMFRTYFGCPKCDAEACDNPTGCELVKEPGICGCCMQCARQQGQACGVYTEKCGACLTCRPSHNSATPFDELILGQGTCQPELNPVDAVEELSKRRRCAVFKRLNQAVSRSHKLQW